MRTAKMVEIDQLLDAGVAPAEAVAAMTVGRIALETLARNLDFLEARGATAEELAAYEADADLGAWIMRHLPAMTEFASKAIDARLADRAATRADVAAVLG